MDDIHIKQLHTLEVYNQFIELQKIIWKIKNNAECIPDYILLTADEHGGLVLGAFHRNALIGINLIVPAFSPENGYYYYAQLLGIHPNWHHQGIGYMFKKAQYRLALQKGVKKILWTYDPLLGPNAMLNIVKSGGIVREYRINMYGELIGGSELISGIPSDRFLLEWYIDTDRVRKKMKQEIHGNRLATNNNIQPLNSLFPDDNGHLRMKSGKFDTDDKVIYIEIPEDFQSIFNSDKKRALDWRLKTRELFTDCFAAGYSIVDFLRLTSDKESRNIYVLEKEYVLV